jgi:hypothetical protein
MMSGTYPVSIIDKWRTMRDTYDLDQTKPNPYEEVDSRTPVFCAGSCLLLIYYQTLRWPSSGWN